MVTNLLNGCGRKCDAMNSGWKSLLLGGSNVDVRLFSLRNPRAVRGKRVRLSPLVEH